MHKSGEWRLNYVARVEGEGGLDLVISDGAVEAARLRIFEPPRFFEGFLEGRKYDEVSDITARICGICPISYQMASCTAIEKAFRFTPSEQTKRLRRMFSWAEVMQSHALHVYMLAAPDYLGVDGVPELAAKFPEVTARALRLKRTVNDLSKAIGGREVHPVVPKVTGFYDVPSKQTIAELREKFELARDDAIETVKMAAGFDLPDLKRQTDYLCLSHDDMYALNEGRVKTLGGLDFPVEEFLDHIEERQVPHSNALQCLLKDTGESYHTGPLARVNINYKHLSDTTKGLLSESGIDFPSQNPFHGIVARGAEILTGVEECLALLDGFEPEPEEAEIEPRASEGFGISEAPRGSLFHRYVFDDKGIVKRAHLIPPTSQNLARMEDDLMILAPTLLDQPEDKLALSCEMLVRSYDPCISCATHFLKVNKIGG
jgi:sulfhydrogenase subunit alpha